VFAHATFRLNLGVTSRTTSLKESRKCVWIEVSLFPLLSFPLTGYTSSTADYYCVLPTLNSKVLSVGLGGFC